MSRAPVVVWTILRVAAAVPFVGWAALHLRLLDAVIGVTLPEWLTPAGMALLLIGGGVVLVCGGMLNTPGIVPTEFVVRGLFRYVRNPMSLGAVTMMLGFGTVLSISFDFALFGAAVSPHTHLRGVRGRTGVGEEARRPLPTIQTLCESLAADTPSLNAPKSHVLATRSRMIANTTSKSRGSPTFPQNRS